MALHEEPAPTYINLREVVRYTDPSLSPFQVAQSTAGLLDLYFSPNLLTDPDPAKQYFANATLGFIWSAEKGFYRNLDKVDRTGKISAEDLERLMTLARQQGKGIDVEEDEAFGFTLVTFGFMPEMATHRFLSMGFSRRGVMAPPFTTREYLLRLRELRREITRIVSGEIDQNAPIEKTAGLWRTYWFFHVGRDIPLHMQEEPQQVQKATGEFLNKLLEGIDLM